MYKTSIRTNILTIFLFLIGLVSISLLTSQYYFNNKIAVKSTQKTFQLISKNISEKIASNNDNIKSILLTNKNNSKLNSKIEFDYKHPALQTLIDLISIKNNIYAAYFAHNDGSFYELINMDESPLLYKKYKAPKETRWTVLIHIDNQIQYTFLDKTATPLKIRVAAKKYNPLERPWYKGAINTQGVFKTEPYLFTNLKETGTTYSISVMNNRGVLALDYTMQEMNSFLKAQKFEEDSEIFLFNKNGNKLSSSKDFQTPTTPKFQASKDLIKFTQQEQEFIDNAPTLIVSNEQDWIPFDFQSAGKPMGYSIDLLQLIAQKSGLKIQFVNGLSWAAILSSFKKKNIDIVHSLYKTEKREKFGSFSKPYYSFKNYFITRKDAPKISSFSDLKDKRIGIVAGWQMEEYLKNNYPDIKVLKYKNLSSNYFGLSNNEIDVLIGTKEEFSFITHKLYIDNLKLDGWCSEYDNNSSHPIYIMVDKEQKTLLSIINKTLDSITADERTKLQKKWLNATIHKSTMIDPQMMDSFLRNKAETIEYDLDKKHYYALYKALDKDLYVGVKINSELLFAPYQENMKYSFLIAFILLLLALPLVIYGTYIIVEPIKKLIEENKKIKNRQFADVNKVDTNIYELIELSNSMVSMASSISEFQRSQEQLLDSIVKLIADAIDAKSPYTGGHCKRVPVIAQMLVDKADKTAQGPFKEFSFKNEDELREFELGAWLHDCGKVTTPEYVVDKATKLETIYNRIHEIRTRFEVLWRDAQIRYLESRLDGEDKEKALQTLNTEQQQLMEEFEFIANTNIGGEYMDPAKQEKIKEIAQREWVRHFDDRLGISEDEKLRYDPTQTEQLPVIEKLLCDKEHHIVKRENFDYEAYEKAGFKEEVPEYLYNYGEIYNLCIEKGTLTTEERYKIDEHIIMTIKMLEAIPFPQHLTRVPEYAGTHHETLIGTGYPRELTAKDLSIPARAMAIADIFEALTASDRPYKKAKTLSESLKIMSFMVKDQHIDGELFRLFLESDLHTVYAKQYLKPEQIDEVNIEDYL
ncbi:MAG: transporter substrate-binding domain-containing protein [Sulfurimonas sp.]